MFEKSATQSNPVFGKSGLPYYMSNDREMAINGFVTPNQLVCYSFTDDNGELIQFTGTEDEEHEIQNMKEFIRCMSDIIMKHHNRIQKDSNGHRSGFMLVTVPGNRYLKAIRNSSEFLGWANANKVGVYMTSSPLNDKENEYEAGGQIKFYDDDNWYPERVNINDFIDIINDNVDNKGMKGESFKRFALTKEISRNHINVIINIEQLNTGVNLPGLNGVFIARYLNKNNPLAKQIPGRVSRTDVEDRKTVGRFGNKAACPCCETGVNEDGTYKYVKPYSYIYICPNMFTPEQRVELKEFFESFYDYYAMTKIIVDGNNEGIADSEDPDNSNKIQVPIEQLINNRLPNGNEKVFNLLKYSFEMTAEMLLQEISEKATLTDNENVVNYVIEHYNVLYENQLNKIFLRNFFAKLEEIEKNH